MNKKKQLATGVVVALGLAMCCLLPKSPEPLELVQTVHPSTTPATTTAIPARLPANTSDHRVSAPAPEAPPVVTATPTQKRAPIRTKEAPRVTMVPKPSLAEGAERLEHARRWARQRQIPVQGRNGDHAYALVDVVDGHPRYFITHNQNAAISTAADQIRDTAPYDVNGDGLSVGVWDEGPVRATHQDLTGRVTNHDSTATSDHATHVAGTIASGGLNAAAMGMAPQVHVDAYDWFSDTNEAAAAAASYPGQPGALYASNHSYGIGTGWHYTNLSGNWGYHWFGTWPSTQDPNFGQYDSDARDWDNIVYSSPWYLPFRSAGNDRNDDPFDGTTVYYSTNGFFSWQSKTFSSATDPLGDGVYKNGYDTITTAANAKNIMTVGAVNDAVSGGSRNLGAASMIVFSSWGPTDDGRIKPDVVANGLGLFSTTSNSDSSYGSKSGTSMSSPNACGSAILLQEYFGDRFGGAMRASTLRGLLIHTADDLGNAGPDYSNGWGLMNVEAAAERIATYADTPSSLALIESRLHGNQSSETWTVVWDGVSPIRATLCWTDPPGAASSGDDDSTSRLVNHLDLVVTNASNSFQPFVLNPANPSALATTGVNNVDNVEQVLIESPVAGSYDIRVSHTGTLTDGEQVYSLLLSGVTASPAAPTVTSLTASTGSGSDFQLTAQGNEFLLGATLMLRRDGHTDIVASNIQVSSDQISGNVDLDQAATGSWDVVVVNPDGQSGSLDDSFSVQSVFWLVDFEGDVSDWSSAPDVGAGYWTLSTSNAYSPTRAWFGLEVEGVSLDNLYSPVVQLPADMTNLSFSFWHYYDTEFTYDGGVLELSADGGNTWYDVLDANAGASFTAGAYNSALRDCCSQQLPNREAWSGSNGGYTRVVVALDSAVYAGNGFRARWRLSCDEAVVEDGWYIDDVSLTGSTQSGFSVNVDPLAVPEGGSATLQVALETAPLDTVTVSATIISGDSDLSVTAGSSLTFTVGDWNQTQNVTIAAAEDADSIAGSATLQLEQTGGSDVIPTRTVTLNEFEDDISVTMSSTVGGTTVPDGEFGVEPAQMPYAIQAVPDTGYVFQRWLGNIETLADAFAANTTFTTASSITLLAVFADEDAPTPPDTITSSSHAVGLWSTDNTVDVAWSGASDAGSGVSGSSFLFSRNADDVPDTVVDQLSINGSTTSASLPDDTWYFHIRMQDQAGNWSDAAHHGPYLIDTSAPDITGISAWQSSAHVVAVPAATDQGDQSVSFTWTVDSSASGQVFYSELNNSAQPSISGDETSSSAAFRNDLLLPNGISYFHVRAKNNAGTWGTESVFEIRFRPEVSIGPLSQSIAETGGQATVTLTLNAVSDVALSVPLGLSGSASDDDYTVFPNPVPIEAGNLTADVTVLADSDIVAEGSETITITLLPAPNVVIGSNDNADVTLLDDDHAPDTEEDSYTVAEDSPLSVAAPGVLINDSDADGDAISASLFNGTANGNVTMQADGSFVYEPDEHFFGQDSFQYRAWDGTNYSLPETVSVEVTGSNDAPQAVPDAYSVLEDDTLTVPVPGVLLNDQDPDPDTLTAILDSSPAHGTLTLSEDGSFIYQPDEDYVGEDEFRYTVHDGTVDSEPTTVTIDVGGVNDPPTATDDAYDAVEDIELNVAAPGVLANDVDADSSLIAVLDSLPAHGTLDFNADGSFSYLAELDYNGPDSFTYHAFDGEHQSAVRTVSLNVAPANDAPVASGHSYVTAEDNAIVEQAPGLLAGDSDPDGDALTAVVAVPPSHGTLNLNADGSFEYTPNPDFNGSDQFQYQASDGFASSPPTTVTISVTPLNDPPDGALDTYVVNEDDVLLVEASGVLMNDVDIDSVLLTAVLDSPAEHGTVVLAADGGFTYTPDPDFTGLDHFSYRAYDGLNHAAPADVEITVIGQNDAPTAGDDAYHLIEDESLTVGAPGVLVNDADVDGDTLEALVDTEPIFGELQLFNDGSFQYTPYPDFHGVDSFTYVARDNDLASEVAMVTLNVAPTNDAPVGAPEQYDVTEDVTLQIAAPGVLENDNDLEGDSMTAAIVSPPAHGILNLNADGSFDYTPNLNFFGTDSFEYQAADATLQSGPITVTLDVLPQPDPPVAVADSYTGNEDESLAVGPPGLLNNDYDPDGETVLMTSLVEAPLHGQLAMDEVGAFVYTPDADFNGTDSFTYRCSDGALTADATVTLEILPTNDAPIGNDENYTVIEDGALHVNAPGVLGNDGDIDGDTLSAELLTNPTHGVLVFSGNGSFSYTPHTDYRGDDSFTYQASDGTATSAPVTVSLSVASVNDPPVAVADQYGTDEDVLLTVAAPGLLGNDFDVDMDTLSTKLLSPAANGQLSVSADGSFTYLPDADYSGVDSFTYRAEDGASSSLTVTVEITVTAVNDVPTAGDDNYSIAEDQSLTVSAPGFLGNDADAETALLAVTVVDVTAHGQLDMGAGGAFVYTPNANYYGTDRFRYQVSDGEMISDLATVTFTITPVNDKPVAAGETFAMTEDLALAVAAPGVLENDLDADNDTLRVVLVDGPASGELLLEDNGSFVYTPAPDANGPVTFRYRVQDDISSSGVVEAVLNIAAENDSPAPVEDSYTIDEDSELMVAAPGVLGNDNDVDLDVLNAVLHVAPDHGDLTLSPDGSFVYTPAPHFNGTDRFAYQATDGTVTSAPVFVNIDVTPVNDIPLAVVDLYQVSEDGVLDVAAPGPLVNDVDPDGDPLMVVFIALPVHGTFTWTPDSAFTYTPAPDFYGNDHFSYYVTDGQSDSLPVTATIEVLSVNDPPAGSDDSYALNDDAPLVVEAPGLLTNDLDFDSITLTCVLLQEPQHGTVNLSGDGSFTYSSDAGFSGDDSFTYVIDDGLAVSDPVTVYLDVNALPQGGPDALTLNAGEQLDIPAATLLANDFDQDGDGLTLVIETLPAQGTLTPQGGDFVYQPAPTFFGVDEFTYHLDDGRGQSPTVAVTLTVNGIPEAMGDAYATDEDSTLEVAAPGLLANDIDPDANPLTIVVVQEPAKGTLSISPDGGFLYEPDANVFGSDLFTYHLDDGHADSAIVEVAITVASVNDAPVAQPEQFMVNEDESLTVAAPGILGNDNDVDDSELTIVLETPVNHGSLDLNQDGGFVYTPNADFNGTDGFQYRLSDGDDESATVTVTLDVASVNDRPEITFFHAADATELIAGYADERTVDVQLTATDIDDSIVGWQVTESSLPPPADDAHWLATPPTTYTITGPEGEVTLYAWALDASGDSNVASETNQATFILEPLFQFTLTVDTQPEQAVRVGQWGLATEGIDPLVDQLHIGQEGTVQARLISHPGAATVLDPLIADIRPRQPLSRWRFELILPPGHPPVNVSFTPHETEPGFLILLQKLVNEQAEGLALDLSQAGVTTVSETSVFELTYGVAQSETLELAPGWNLVSMPIMSADNIGSLAVGRGNLLRDVAWYWTGERYEKADNLAAMNPERAYWVYSDDGGVTNPLSGLPADGLVRLGSGWRLIAPVVDSLPPDALPANGHVNWFDATIQEYRALGIGEPMRVGRGYWHYLTEHVELWLNSP